MLFGAIFEENFLEFMENINAHIKKLRGSCRINQWKSATDLIETVEQKREDYKYNQR